MNTELEHVFVFFSSPNGRDLWRAVQREDLPDWIRDESIIDRLLAGEQVRNTAEKTERYFKVVEIDRPRPAGQHKARAAAMRAANGESPGGIALLH